jgi:hypothetical protein
MDDLTVFDVLNRLIDEADGIQAEARALQAIMPGDMAAARSFRERYLTWLN